MYDLATKDDNVRLMRTSLRNETPANDPLSTLRLRVRSGRLFLAPENRLARVSKAHPAQRDRKRGEERYQYRRLFPMEYEPDASLCPA